MPLSNALIFDPSLTNSADARANSTEKSKKTFILNFFVKLCDFRPSVLLSPVTVSVTAGSG